MKTFIYTLTILAVLSGNVLAQDTTYDGHEQWITTIEVTNAHGTHTRNVYHMRGTDDVKLPKGIKTNVYWTLKKDDCSHWKGMNCPH